MQMNATVSINLVEEEDLKNVAERPVPDLVPNDRQHFVAGVDAAVGAAAVAGQQTIIQHHRRTRAEAVHKGVSMLRPCSRRPHRISK